jgi:hypothetical protein
MAADLSRAVREKILFTATSGTEVDDSRHSQFLLPKLGSE